jgi:hypothetical protein
VDRRTLNLLNSKYAKALTFENLCLFFPLARHPERERAETLFFFLPQRQTEGERRDFLSWGASARLGSASLAYNAEGVIIYSLSALAVLQAGDRQIGMCVCFCVCVCVRACIIYMYICKYVCITHQVPSIICVCLCVCVCVCV